MENRDTPAEEHSDGRPARLRYHRPALVEYGHLAKLTAGISGSAADLHGRPRKPTFGGKT
jgi:hypothetical protein